MKKLGLVAIVMASALGAFFGFTFTSTEEKGRGEERKGKKELPYALKKALDTTNDDWKIEEWAPLLGMKVLYIEVYCKGLDNDTQRTEEVKRDVELKLRQTGIEVSEKPFINARLVPEIEMGADGLKHIFY